MKQKTILLIALLLFTSLSIYCQTAVFGGKHIITQSYRPFSIQTADLNSDGYPDIISDSKGEGTIVWYKNNGNGNFSTPIIITDSLNNLNSIHVADLNNDGFPDILAVLDIKIIWYENDGSGNFVKKTNAIQEAGVLDIFTADLDGDGYPDLITSTHLEINWFANNGTGNFSQGSLVADSVYYVYALFASDLDKDGNADVLFASNAESKFGWCRNDGNGNFSAPEIISDSVFLFGGAKNIYATDINGNGYNDVVCVHATSAAWHENDGSGNFVLKQVIYDSTYSENIVDVSYIDNDSFPDIILGNPELGWYEYGSSGNFILKERLNPDVDYACIVDLDQDGYKDVLAAHNHGAKIAWHKNDGNGNLGYQQWITKSVSGLSDLYVADINNDGYKDILSASFNDDKIAWYPNDGGGDFNVQEIISDTAYSASCVSANDIDNDGNTDIMTIIFPQVQWYKNNGPGNFDMNKISDVNASFAPSGRDILAIDINGDSYKDVLSALQNKICWFENNGNGNFNSQGHLIDSVEVCQIYASDINNDGYPDVLSASPSKITWYENNGNGQFSTAELIKSQSSSIYPADLNNDGYIDILTAPQNKVTWFENDGTGNFSGAVTITDSVKGYGKVFAADMNGNGFPDVVVISPSKITWYENDGSGNFGYQHIIAFKPKYDFYTGFIADLNGDGSKDVLAASQYEIMWYENLGNVGINETETPKVSLYPNPVADKVHLAVNIPVQNICVYDLAGKEIINIETEITNEATINLSDMRSGVYILRIQTANKVFTKKIVKQ